MTLFLPDDVEQMLVGLAEEDAINLNEMIRKTIKSEAFLRRKAKEGYGVRLVKDDEIVEVVFR